jgi:hypothetical protein
MAETTVPLCSPSVQRSALSNYQHRRRDLLGGIAGAAVVGTAVAVPAPAEAATDPHVGWMAEWRAISAAWPKGKDIERGDPASEHLWGLERQIVATPATTVAGLLVQTELGLFYLGAEDPRGPYEDDLDYKVLRGIRAGLERLA